MNPYWLRSKFIKAKSNESKNANNTKRNYCLTLVRKAKKEYHNNLHHENFMIKFFFWKSIKPLYSEKSWTHNKIRFAKQNSISDKNDNVAEVLNSSFTNAVSNLNIPKYHDNLVNINHIQDPIARSMEQYENYPGIIAINNKSTNTCFKFNSISKSRNWEGNIEFSFMESM